MKQEVDFQALVQEYQTKQEQETVVGSDEGEDADQPQDKPDLSLPDVHRRQLDKVRGVTRIDELIAAVERYYDLNRAAERLRVTRRYAIKNGASDTAKVFKVGTLDTGGDIRVGRTSHDAERLHLFKFDLNNRRIGDIAWPRFISVVSGDREVTGIGVRLVLTASSHPQNTLLRSHYKFSGRAIGIIAEPSGNRVWVERGVGVDDWRRTGYNGLVGAMSVHSMFSTTEPEYFSKITNTLTEIFATNRDTWTTRFEEPFDPTPDADWGKSG